MLGIDFNMKFYITSVFKIIVKTTPHINALRQSSPIFILAKRSVKPVQLLNK